MVARRLKAVFDGANLAYPTHSGGRPELGRLEAVVDGVARRFGLAVNEDVVVVLDRGAQRRFEEHEAGALARFRARLGRDRLVGVPGYEKADPHVLAYARAADALVVSGDRFATYPSRCGLFRIAPLLLGDVLSVSALWAMGATPKEDVEQDIGVLDPPPDDPPPDDPSPDGAPEVAAPETFDARVRRLVGEGPVGLSVLGQRLRAELGDAYATELARAVGSARSGALRRFVDRCPGLVCTDVPGGDPVVGPALPPG